MARDIKTMDGNMAAAFVSYAYTEAAAIYPITPSSPMADYTDIWSANGKRNIFQRPVKLVEMQSEAGAAGTFHGLLSAGALASTYTSSQGLLLMIPNMYKVAGELLPGVIHVAARTIATHALSIFGDHQDIYACRQTGFAMLASSSVQEIMDLGAVAHLSAIEGRVPFLHFFDGFRTSHEIQKIKVWNYDDLKEMCNMEAVKAFKKRSLNPERPVLKGTAQNSDIFFQIREGCNVYYNQIPDIVEKYMNEVNKKVGAHYNLFDYYGDPNAEKIIIAMGSVCETIEETIDYLLQHGEKVGVIKVHLYRPFSAKHFIKCIPKTVKVINVLDRTKEPGSVGEPLYLDVVAALKGSDYENTVVLNGRYGLSSKNTTPADIIAVFDNLTKKNYTVGIVDDVTNTSLNVNEKYKKIDTTPAETISCKFWGLGADGTVGANKNTIKIIGDYTDKYVQAYFDYDSKKSGGLTVSHLRFGKEPIKSAYLIENSDFTACHCQAYIGKYEMIREIRKDGIFLLNCSWSENEILEKLSYEDRKYMADNGIRMYIIDGNEIAQRIGLGGKINTILQAAFFKLTNILPIEVAVSYMKKMAKNSYAKKGEDVIKMNYQAIECGVTEIKRVKVLLTDDELKKTKELSQHKAEEVMDYNVLGASFVETIQKTINHCKGNELPVSAFKQMIDGTMPQGTAAYEKRAVALKVPKWNENGCIQCNRCAYVCPHGVIRPVVLNKEELKKAPKTMRYTKMNGVKEKFYFSITASVYDCTGCFLCANICPGNLKNDVIHMEPFEQMKYEQDNYNYAQHIGVKDEIVKLVNKYTVKGSQFVKPLLEFSGACAGCGETAYAKLITQLFGNRMIIANATGCSSIWGGSMPSSPYTVNNHGFGPAWANSLFEDNAEFGYGIKIASEVNREELKIKLIALKKVLIENSQQSDTYKDMSNCKENMYIDKDYDRKKVCNKIIMGINEYMDSYERDEENQYIVNELIEALVECKNAYIENDKFNRGTGNELIGNEQPQMLKIINDVLEKKEYLSKKSHWIFGGDGWAYDIGFGGLDHVLASGEDINVLVFNTEIYSNTGGQASKATNTGAVAQFAAQGKSIKKKELADMFISYGYVYVAQVSLGADMNQCINAIKEAEMYNGPSIIIAYAPCISHGIRAGMSNSVEEERKAVLSGYWHLFRYNPQRKMSGKNPFLLDSKEPVMDYDDFIMGENRYINLDRQNHERAKFLFKKAKQDSLERYRKLFDMSREE